MIFGWRTESGGSEKRESRKKETVAASDADRIHVSGSSLPSKRSFSRRFRSLRVPVSFVLAMYSSVSGVLQSVSPWSTMTLPIFLATSMAFFSNLSLSSPIVISAPFISFCQLMIKLDLFLKFVEVGETDAEHFSFNTVAALGD